MENKMGKKKKPAGSFWWVAVLLMLGALSETEGKVNIRRMLMPVRFWFYRMGIDPEWGIPLLFTVVIVALILIIVAVAKRKVAAKSDKAPTPAPAAQRRDPRTASFTKPDAHCVSCELSGDDHFARDRQQRIRQLDEWLKNGIIDREEYRQLKQRYQRDQ